MGRNSPLHGIREKAGPATSDTITGQGSVLIGNRHVSKKTLLIFAAIFAAFGVYMVFRSFAAVPVQPNALGVYTGPAGVQSHNSFSTSLGRDANYALDFADDSQPWVNIASYSDWMMDPWSAWIKAKPERRLVVSLPMLNQASAGQLVQGRDGAFDQYFRTFAEELIAKDLGNSVIRLGWEANGDWYPWKASTNPQAWKDYYRRIVGVMRSTSVAGKPVPTFQFDLNYNLGNSGTANTFESMYPGDDVVDIIGLDAYDVKWMDSTSTPDVRWNNLLTQKMGLNEFKAFAAAHNKPMSIPEWGLWPKGTQDGGGGDNPYYIDRMADWIEANKSTITYQSYFNHLSGGNDGDHRLISYPNSQSRYYARFGAPPVKQGDINSDNAVNIFDLSILLSNYGKTVAQSSDPDCDINANGTIDIFDLSILLSKYGT